METSLPIDTHSSIKALVAAGVPEEQAEVHVRIFATTVTQNLATKRDISDVRKDLEGVRKDLESVRKDLEAKIEAQGKDLEAKIEAQGKDLEAKMQSLELKVTHKLTLRLGGIVIACTGILLALIPYLVSLSQ